MRKNQNFFTIMRILKGFFGVREFSQNETLTSDTPKACHCSPASSAEPGVLRQAHPVVDVDVEQEALRLQGGRLAHGAAPTPSSAD